VAAENADAVTAYLDKRELVTGVYAPKFLNVRLDGGECVPAYVFVARRDHEQYAGNLPPERTAELLVKGRGLEGSGLEYLRNTITHLDELGIRDGPLHRILALAQAQAGKRS
jgi:cation transport protein ChaC